MTKKERVISRIWDNLDELQEQMTSGAAEGMTQRQLDFVDERLADMLKETSKWFVGLVKEYAGNRKQR
jgi:hypothetical protein